MAVMRGVVVFSILSTFSVAFTSPQEPVCTSRFDYDHKMLHKMVLLEIEQNTQGEIIQSQAETIEILTGKLRDITKKYDRFITKMSSVSLDSTGSTFIRWGRSSCPGNGTEMVYKGYAAGSHYNSKRGGSNYICLPEEPLWRYYEDQQQTSSTVWGVEYELTGRNMNKFFGQALYDKDVPCSVCHTKRASVLMVPGKNKCYDHWTLEYSGYLVSEHETHSSADFVCLDGEPEYLSGGRKNDNGKLMYFAEGRCGSLRCPPYVDGRELTCAVCTK